MFQDAIDGAGQPIGIEQIDFTAGGGRVAFQTVRDDGAELVEQTKQGALLISFDDRLGAVARILAESAEVGMWQDGTLIR